MDFCLFWDSTMNLSRWRWRKSQNFGF